MASCPPPGWGRWAFMIVCGWLCMGCAGAIAVVAHLAGGPLRVALAWVLGVWAAVLIAAIGWAVWAYHAEARHPRDY